MTEKQILRLVHKEDLKRFRKQQMKCTECGGIATERIKRNTWHIDENEKVVTDIWYDYFCKQCTRDDI